MFFIVSIQSCYIFSLSTIFLGLETGVSSCINQIWELKLLPPVRVFKHAAFQTNLIFPRMERVFR